MRWEHQEREDELIVYQVSPTNLDDIRGELDGVILSGTSIEGGYYTDIRSSGTLEFLGDEWIRGSFIRLVHRLPGYEREMGTFIVTDDPSTREKGVWRTKLELKGMLYALSTDIAERSWTIGEGAYALDAIRQMLDSRNRPNVITGNDYKFGSTTVYEGGKSFLERLFSLCTLSNNRLDADSHGRVTVSPYVIPSLRSPMMELGVSSGMLMDGVTRNSTWLSQPNRSAVLHTYSEDDAQHEISATAELTIGDLAFGNRGYYVTDFKQLDDLSPRTNAQAQKIARGNLNNDRELVEWNVSCAYLPVWEGDVVTLRVTDGMGQYRGDRHCLISDVKIYFSPGMMMDLTLKETSGGDDD